MPEIGIGVVGGRAARWMALVILATTTACGAASSQTPPNPGPRGPSPTETSPSALRDRPVQIRAVPRGAPCPVTPLTTLQIVGSPGLTKLGSYGFGEGPVYLSGQQRWYTGRQAVSILISPTYSGPLLIRSRQFDGAFHLTLAHEDLPPQAVSNLPELVKARGAADGIEMDALPPPRSWHVWAGFLTTDGPGCFGAPGRWQRVQRGDRHPGSTRCRSRRLI